MRAENRLSASWNILILTSFGDLNVTACQNGLHLSILFNKVVSRRVAGQFAGAFYDLVRSVKIEKTFVVAVWRGGGGGNSCKVCPLPVFSNAVIGRLTCSIKNRRRCCSRLSPTRLVRESLSLE